MNGVIRFRDRVCVHLSATRMYQDLKRIFWYPGTKKEVSSFVHACLTCQKSKVKYHKSLGLMQSLSIPEWKWDNISMVLCLVYQGQ